MITKQETYKKAFQNKAAALNEKQRQYDLILNSLYSENPRLSELDLALQSVGARLAFTALSGNKTALKELKAESSALNTERTDILKKAGLKPIKYDCELCNDTGLVSGKICSCVKTEAGRIMAQELSKEMPLDDCRFDNFDLKYYSDKTDAGNKNPRRRMTAVLKLCREYVINFGDKNTKNLLFMGKTGLGKTHLTLAIVEGVIEKGYLPIYGSAENIFNMVEAEKFEGKGKGTYEGLLSCDLLVLDDLGTEMATSFTKSVLYNLINTRILSKKPTIINTNLTMKEIGDRYTERVASRLIGNYEWYEFLGNDIRQQKLLNK